MFRNCPPAWAARSARTPSLAGSAVESPLMPTCRPGRRIAPDAQDGRHEIVRELGCLGGYEHHGIRLGGDSGFQRGVDLRVSLRKGVLQRGLAFGQLFGAGMHGSVRRVNGAAIAPENDFEPPVGPQRLDRLVTGRLQRRKDIPRRAAVIDEVDHRVPCLDRQVGEIGRRRGGDGRGGGLSVARAAEQGGEPVPSRGLADRQSPPPAERSIRRPKPAGWRRAVCAVGGRGWRGCRCRRSIGAAGAIGPGRCC